MSNSRESAPATDAISTDAVFELLRDPRRRTVLALLLAHDRKLTLNDLTKEIVVREHDAPITEIPGDELTRISASLHHNHVPKLAGTPLVEYDEDRRIIEPTERLADLEHLLTPELGADSASVMPCEARDR